MTGLEFTSLFSLKFWLLALAPLLALLITLTGLKWKAPKAGLLSLLIAISVALTSFGMTTSGLLIAFGKSIQLSVFVLLIVWAAVLLYNLVDHVGALKVISKTIANISNDRLFQCLLLSWCFSAFIQGVSGFGVPVAIIAPLMVGIGFSPVVAVVATLVGHAWSVTFGSMASSLFSLALVTDFPVRDLSLWLGGLFIFPITVCGISVAHIAEGFNGVRRSFGLVLVVSLVMGLTLWVSALIGAVQLASLLAGLAGSLAIMLLSKVGFSKAFVSHSETQSGKQQQMDIITAFAPYLCLIGVISIFQWSMIKTPLSRYAVAFSFPEVTTNLGHVVAAEKAYSAIKIFSHPTFFILLAAGFASLMYYRKGYLHHSTVGLIVRKTKKQCVATSISITLVVAMALVMSDSGMTVMLAQGIARVAGKSYPLFAPLVGVLGSFMTGSNTNSNVLFGAFQKHLALTLGVNPYTLAAAQTIGGSLGSAIAPAKVLLGSSTVGLSGKEGEILKKTIMYCLFNALLLGVVILILSSVI